MITITDDREAKLPVWARDQLRSLRNKVAEQETTISLAREEAHRSGCTGKVVAEGLMTKGFPLHDRALVTFYLPDGKVDCMLREGGTILDINTSGPMFIRPQASNSAYVTVQS